MEVEKWNLLPSEMAGLFLGDIASCAAATDGVVSSGEKETIDGPREDDPHNDADNNHNEKLYIHIIKTD
ncbi:MAG: hypothetical protein VB074_13830 [Proteiniphilum sp.]|jgi:hypothetical protein|uniref:hypothetical protein n=1 Tax=Proteiniphilum sp. TaxID=1926877 RepID=UPI00092CAD07|nr:hypothetical protein [Proteiniphilum sp.]MEA5129257.1 hypothetical protein [Proteiniphilum sp.]OJV84936.1 MAG: hypothetical protein BGO34_14400 [Bacteroidia bacterium 44-10]